MKFLAKTLFILLVLINHLSGIANVSLPGLVGSNMVLQRDKPLNIWGWADAGEKVTVLFNGKTYSAITDSEKYWSVKMPPQRQGGPFEMVIEGKNIIKLTNILIGDVYVCSGQSNMEFKLTGALNAQKEISKASYPLIRFFATPYVMASRPKQEASASWLECSPATASNMSAVGYFFARELIQSKGVPIGLIQSHWGGTNIEAWLSLDVLDKDPEFAQKARLIQQTDMDSMIASNTFRFNNMRNTAEKSDSGYGNGTFPWTKEYHPEWPQMQMPAFFETQNEKLKNRDGIIWIQKEINLSAKDLTEQGVLSFGRLVDEDISFLNGVKVGATIDGRFTTRKYPVPKEILKEGTNIITIRVTDYGSKNYKGGFYPEDIMLKTASGSNLLSGEWKYKIGLDTVFETSYRKGIDPGTIPTVLYNGMIAPLLKYSIGGVLWYQGEGNATRSFQYRSLLKSLITDWRAKFNDQQLPFFIVQLPYYQQEDKMPSNSPWAEMREAQFMATQLPGIYAVNIIDLGDTSNAGNIHPPNKQDVGKRLALLAIKHIYGENNLLAQGPVFNKMIPKNNDVILEFRYTGDGLAVNKGKKNELLAFQAETASSGQFVYAKASISGKNQILVQSPDGKPVTAVRYAWANHPGSLNLTNSAGLPAYPFRTDTYKGITYDERYEGK